MDFNQLSESFWKMMNHNESLLNLNNSYQFHDMHERNGAAPHGSIANNTRCAPQPSTTAKPTHCCLPKRITHLVKCSLTWKTLQIWRIRHYSPFCIDFIKHHHHAILDFADHTNHTLQQKPGMSGLRDWLLWHLCGCPGHTSRPHLSQWQAIASCIYSVKRPPKMDLSKVSLLTLTDSEARLFDCFAIFFFNLMVLLWWCFFHGFPALFMFQPLSNENSEQRRLPFLSDGPFGFEASDSLITSI